MVKITDVPADLLIKKLAEKLKEIPEIKQPEWSLFVKTGVSKERRPSNPDWWYIRAASILRKLYLKGPMGVSRLRSLYGGRKNRGSKPEHFYKGSGKIIRTILQQLEAAGFLKLKEANGRKLGRTISDKGKSFVDSSSYLVMKELTSRKKVK